MRSGVANRDYHLQGFVNTALFRCIARLLIVTQLLWGVPVYAQTPPPNSPPNLAAALADPGSSLHVGPYQQIASKRVTRTEFDFTYTASIDNSADQTFGNVRATLTSQTAKTKVTDGELTFGTVAGLQSVASQDTFTIRQDRTVPFDASKLVWTVKANSPPVANPGNDRTVPVGTAVTLDGSQSSDPDGDALTAYRWQLLQSPADSGVTLTGPDTPKPGFTVTKPGLYRFQLIVNDGYLDSVPAIVNISTSNSPPVADAGQDQHVDLGSTVTLDGSHSTDIDGDQLTYAWAFLEKPQNSTAIIVDPAHPTDGTTNTPQPQFAVDLPGTYRIRLIVNDGQVNSAADIVIVGTNNAKPIADAGKPQTVHVGDTVNLSGLLSKDPEGADLTYRWSFAHKPDGSAASLQNDATAQPWFKVDLFGDYVAQLIVSDGTLDSLPTTVGITTENSPPIADAGLDRNANLGDTVQLDGTASRDPNGDTLTYAWSVAHAPVGSTVAINPATDAQPTFTPDKEGGYVVQLLVHDTHNATSTATFKLTVNPKPNRPPHITSTPPTTGTVSQNYNYAVKATDPDTNDILIYSLTLAPEGMGINPSTGLIAWTPNTTQTGSQTVTVKVQDQGGLSDTQSFTITVPEPNRAPLITSTPPLLQPTAGGLYRYDVTAMDLDVGDVLTYSLTTFPVGMSIDPATGVILWTPTLAQLGNQTVKVKVADQNGGSDSQTFTVNVGLVSTQTSVPLLNGKTRSEAQASIQQAKLNPGTETFQHSATVPDGQVISQSPNAGITVEIGAAVNTVVSTGPETSLPPNPATVAPPVDQTVATTVSASTKFLYSGANPIQTGVAPGTIEARRAAVIRGKVMDKQNNPLPGVVVTIKDHAEFGQTMTRADGGYDLAVNGGGYLSLNYQQTGYLPAQRQVNAPWQDYLVVDELVMIALNAKTTTIDLTASVAMQVAQGSPVTDKDGTRQATLMIPQGTQAQVYNADGTLRSTTTLNLHLTEYTQGDNGPAAMPGPLPPNSAYTYAVEIKADEAALKFSGKDAVFDRPVPFYVDNFLNFPAGTVVPVGYYDGDKKAWIPSDSGQVIKILSITGDVADVDGDGDNVIDDAAKLAALGFTDAERQQLAARYAAGKSLWRVRLTHLSTWDLNWPFSPPADATEPNPPTPPPADPKPDHPNCANGSIIQCQNQTLGELIPVNGSSFNLYYQSDRVAGRKAANTLEIPLSGASIPTSLKKIVLETSVAGVKSTQTFPASPNLKHSFIWNGLDGYGRPMAGKQTAQIRIGFVYDGTYQKTNIFGYNGNGVPITGDRARQQVTLWRNTQVQLGASTGSASLAEGWSLSAHHAYDPVGKVLHLGDGGQRSVTEAASNVITTVVGNGTQGHSGDGGLATQANSPISVAVSADGSLYFVDDNRIRKVRPDGIITTVAGSVSSLGYSGDGGPATQAVLGYPEDVAVGADGSLYIPDFYNHRIRRIRPDGIITTVAGNGTSGFSGDGGLATQAKLDAPIGMAVGTDGSLYIADVGNNRIRRVGPDGIITTVAGKGCPGVGLGCVLGDGGPATQARLSYPADLAVGADGSLYIVETGESRIRRVDSSGIITTVAGISTQYYSGDGGPATQAGINTREVAVAGDGSLYIADFYNHRIRRVGPDGIITTLAGTGVEGFIGDGGPAARANLGYEVSDVAVGPDGSVYIADRYNYRIRKVSPSLPGFSVVDFAIPSEDGSEIYRFDSAGKHLSTRNALTGATLLTFGYDSQGRLLKVTDANGNITTIERNALGEPTAIIAPFGQRTELSLDGNGYLASATNPAGEAYAMTYTADGLMTGFKDPRGHASTFTYDELGRLAKDQNAAGGFQTLARETLANGYEVTRSTSENLKVKYKLENLSTGNRLMTNTDADGTQITKLEQTDGTTKTTLPDGTVNTVVQGPDPRYGMQAPIVTSQTMTTGGLSLTQTASRTQTLSNPNDPLSTTSLTDTVTVNSRTTTRVYTVANKTETTTSAGGRISTRTLDALGRVTGTQVTGIAAVNNSYDAQGRLSKISQGTGADERLINLAYNPQGYLQSIADPYGRTGSFTYDLAGRVSKQTLPDGNAIDFTYDKNGNLASLTPPGQPPHVFSYDVVDQPQEYAPPDVAAGLNSTRYQYNTDKKLTKITRPDTLTMNFTYDSAGRLSQLTTPDGATTYTYDASTGKLVKTATPDNIALSFTYNGALLTQTGWNWIGGATPTFTVGYGYDNDFRVNSLQVNGANSVSLQYDADSLLTKAGDLTLNRSAQNGLLTGTVLGKQTDSLSYNGFGEMTQYATNYDGTGQFKTVFTRDKLGRITQKEETLAGVTDVYDYTYDRAGRLAEVRKNNGLQAKYTYDANGNRLKYEGAFIAEGTYDAQDRLLTYGGASYSYTANGELASKTLPSPSNGGGAGGEGLKTSYAYDVLGNLRHVELPDGSKLDYVIDGQNRRIGKKVNGVLKQVFLWQDQLKPIAELDGSDNLVARFVYATHANVPDYMVKGGVTYRLVKDHLGSPRLVVRVSDGFVIQRMDYDEFGNVLMDTNPGFQPFGFAGGLYDRDTGLVRFGARDYDAMTGRWTAKDPIGFEGGNNVYGYALEDPIQYFDPFGLDVRAYQNGIHVVYEFDTSRGLTSFGSGPQLGFLGEAAALITSPFPIPIIPGRIDEGDGYGQRGGYLIYTLPLSKEQGDTWAKKIRDLAKTNPPYHSIHQNCSSLGGFFRSP